MTLSGGSDTGARRCEDCGAATESITGLAYGGSGSSRSGEHCSHTLVQAVQPAPAMLGRPGFLCRRCWWARNLRSQAAA